MLQVFIVTEFFLNAPLGSLMQQGLAESIQAEQPVWPTRRPLFSSSRSGERGREGGRGIMSGDREFRSAARDGGRSRGALGFRAFLFKRQTATAFQRDSWPLWPLGQSNYLSYKPENTQVNSWKCLTPSILKVSSI